MPGPIIALSLVTLGAGIAVGVQQRRKMKKQIPDDENIRPSERLQTQRAEEATA